MNRIKDLTGQKFGRLKVLQFARTDKRHKSYWLCKCDCGKEKVILGYNLTSGATISCGCYQRETVTIHGCSHNTKTTEYSSWVSMKRRCYAKTANRYSDYGGRGVTVCDRWLHSFENFLADMGKKPNKKYSIDRIDNNGNYEPSNCKWSTPAEQAKNRRKHNKPITKIS